MTELEYLESVFFKVLADLKDYLDDLTLVGGWLPYVYSHFVWDNLVVKPITTTDIDFGIGADTTKVYPRTIFDLLSSKDYKERHPQMDRMFPVVLYKEGKIRLDFIAPPKIGNKVIEQMVGKEIDINKIEKFDFLLKNRMLIEIRNKKMAYMVHCPKPSAFLYHKGATFTEREDEQKQAKDLHYMYFILRYAPDIETVLKEAGEYNRKGLLKEVPRNLDKYFSQKTGNGCLMVEKENGPDPYVDDLREDIFERFKKAAGVIMTAYITSIDSYKGVTIVRFAGSITFANLASAQAEWRAKTKGKAVKNILFDLKEVSQTDTSGLAALIDLLKHMKSRQAGDKIGLINLSREIKDLLEISKIAPLFTEYSSEEEAITDLT